MLVNVLKSSFLSVRNFRVQVAGLRTLAPDEHLSNSANVLGFAHRESHQCKDNVFQTLPHRLRIHLLPYVAAEDCRNVLVMQLRGQLNHSPPVCHNCWYTYLNKIPNEFQFYIKGTRTAIASLPSQTLFYSIFKHIPVAMNRNRSRYATQRRVEKMKFPTP